MIKKIESTYDPDKLLPLFVQAAKIRNQLNKAGLTDNAGAIHTCERIINIISHKLKYPRLSHPNKFKDSEYACFSLKAKDAYSKNEKVFIEHVSPLRDFTKKAIEIATKSDAPFDALKDFIKLNYELVLLTQDETTQLNRKNRSKMSPTRLADVGIKLAPIRKLVQKKK